MMLYRTELRVRFSETDRMQFLHNVKYIEYFEVARTEMLRHYGLPYKTIEDNGYEMPVTETFVKYKSPAYYDDILIIESKVEKNSGAKVHIDYKVIRKETGQVLAEGYNVLAFINRQTKKLCRPPDFFVKALNKFFEPQHA